MLSRNQISDQVKNFQNEFERLFFGRNQDYLPDHEDGDNPFMQNFSRPLTDVIETDKEVIISVDLPGVEKKDINVVPTGRGLEITVEKRVESKVVEGGGLSRIERRYLGFYRNIPLHAMVDVEKCMARYTNGVLELKIPKTSRRKTQQIEVK